LGRELIIPKNSNEVNSQIGNNYLVGVGEWWGGRGEIKR